MSKVKLKSNNGYIIVSVLVMATVAIILLTGLTTWAVTNYRLVSQTVDREKAFQAAEAGIDYYRWHLAHATTDYRDGTATSGPYIHPYYDKMGALIGRFELTITPPLVGSTVVKVVSKGIVATSSVARSIEVIMAIPTMAKYAMVSNSFTRFGDAAEVFGPVHGNQGIRFDGIAHNIVTSAVASYDDPDHGGGNELGVHTHRNVPPATGYSVAARPEEMAGLPTPIRLDAFMAGRQFPVPAIDFTGFTQDLAGLKTIAAASNSYFAGSGVSGYNVVLKTDGTFDLYKVTLLSAPPAGCSAPNWEGQEKWGTWSIGTQELVQNYPLPASGVIFLEDNVWVEGQINNARVTIATGRFPESFDNSTSITVNKDILYTNYDGRDVISLIAQYNVNVGLLSENDLHVDAALIAKNGRLGRFYYHSACGAERIRAKYVNYGMYVDNLRGGVSYSDSTGYLSRTYTYDGNLLYSPPPSFPLTSDQYQTISWREI